MKESFPKYFPKSINPENLHDEKSSPVWEHPESELFVDWYLQQVGLTEGEQSPEFSLFLEKVAHGLASIPTAEQLARRKVDEARLKTNE